MRGWVSGPSALHEEEKELKMEMGGRGSLLQHPGWARSLSVACQVTKHLLTNRLPDLFLAPTSQSMVSSLAKVHIAEPGSRPSHCWLAGCHPLEGKGERGTKVTQLAK